MTDNWTFPILGGRLLKFTKGLRQKSCYFVSNPWREAIEAFFLLSILNRIFWFPILGGRLLKKGDIVTFNPLMVGFQSLEGGY